MMTRENEILQYLLYHPGSSRSEIEAGYMIGANLDLAGSYGYYWTRPSAPPIPVTV